MDLLYGYWQVLMHPDDVHKTSIRTPLGAFEYLVMPMGLTNASATFQRMMESILRPYLLDFCMVYLDDVIIYSKTPEEHRKHVMLVLQKLREHHLKIKLKRSATFSNAASSFWDMLLTRLGETPPSRRTPARLRSCASGRSRRPMCSCSPSSGSSTITAA